MVLLLAALVCSSGCRNKVKEVEEAEEAQGGEARAEEGFATVDELGEAVFEALSTSDTGAYERCVATEEDLEFVIGQMDVEDGEMKKEVVADLREDVGEARESLGAITRAAKQSGVDLAEASFDGMEYRVGESGGLTGSDPVLYVKHEGTRYAIRMNNCMKTADGWKAFDRMRWSGAE